MNIVLNEYVKKQLHLFNKINDLYNLKVKGLNVFNIFNQYIKKTPLEDFYLNDIYDYAIHDLNIFQYIKISIFNIVNNYELQKINIYYGEKILLMT